MDATSWLRLGITITLIGLSVLAAGHALLNKADSRSGLGWIVVCLTFPGLGALAYAVFGVDRIKTRGRKLMPGRGESERLTFGLPPGIPPELLEIAKISDAVDHRPLLGGNKVTPLFNGEEAYPEMIAAIEGAKHSVRLLTYIFDTKEIGKRFMNALAEAVSRGVKVQVLIDGLGSLYSFPTARWYLKRRGVRVEYFLPLLRTRLHINLRNHRKLLIVDDETGFTGGMNISARHMVSLEGIPNPTRDIHFRVEGPVVAQLTHAFLEDWYFASDDPISRIEVPQTSAVGDSWCRAICDGPNEDFDKLTWIGVGAMSTARSRIQVMTPYFIPTRELITSLNNAALRGVQVDILLPEKSNLRVVDWASRPMVRELLEYGVRIHLQPEPFVHSKILLIDDHYTVIGSANLDPRSLKLNFEFNLEVFDDELVQTLSEHVNEALGRSKELTIEDLDSRPLWVRLRDATARLFSPYL